jgi:hypothetical protein
MDWIVDNGGGVGEARKHGSYSVARCSSTVERSSSTQGTGANSQQRSSSADVITRLLNAQLLLGICRPSLRGYHNTEKSQADRLQGGQEIPYRL